MQKVTVYKTIIPLISVIVLLSISFYIIQNTFLDENINQKQRRADKEKAEQRSQKNSSSKSQKDNSFLGTSKTVEDTRGISEINSSKKSKKSSPDNEQQNNSASKKQVPTPETNQNNNQSQDAQKDESKDSLKPQITITSPQQKVAWRGQTKQMITWEGRNLADTQVSIVLRKSNKFCQKDQTCKLFVNSSTPQYKLAQVEGAKKKWTWEIPPLNEKERPSGTYVLFFKNERGKLLAKSPSISLLKENTQPFIELIQPVKEVDSSVRKGKRLLITWKSSPDLFKVKAQLIQKEKTVRTIAQNVNNKRIISWRIPSDIQEGTYTVKLKARSILSQVLTSQRKIRIKKKKET